MSAMQLTGGGKKTGRLQLIAPRRWLTRGETKDARLQLIAPE
jgi:hypothetical protein